MAYRVKTDKPHRTDFNKKSEEGAREKSTFKREPDSYRKKENAYRSPKKNEDSYSRPEKPGFRSKSKDQKPAPQESIPAVQPETDELPYLLIGRNAVREAIRAGRSIDKILVSAETDGSLKEILGMARDSKLIIREVDRKKLDELCMPFGHGGKTANHQGIVAYAAGVEYCTVQDILEEAKARGEQPFVIVLDGIEDPHNLGSIIRSAECVGAHGVVIGKRRSASVTSAAVKASAGAAEYMKIARVVNIRSAVDELKKAGVWIAGADMHGSPMGEQNLSGPLALVIGSEGDGLSKLVRESCDLLVSIPMKGHIDSLNAGVAAAILMYEKCRQDRK